MNNSIVCIGGSKGAVPALQTILRGLPSKRRASIVVALHRHVSSRDVLMRLLRPIGATAIVEPYDKEDLSMGAIYLAPPNYHMLVDTGSIHLSVDEPEHNSRPSIDALFETAARAFGNRTIAVVLSGSNRDGATGANLVHSHGGLVLVQDPAEAESPEMPLATLKRVPNAQIMTADAIAGKLGLFLKIRTAGT